MMITEKKGFVFKFTLFQPTSFVLALSYNHRNHITHGILLSHPPTDYIRDLISKLKSNHFSTSHPLLLAIFTTEFVIDTCGNRIQTCDRQLKNLEEIMGQHEYIDLPIGNPLETDSMATTRRLNFMARTLAAETMRLGAMLLTLEYIKMYAKEMTWDTRKAEDAGNDAGPLGVDEGSDEIHEQVAYLKYACQYTLLRAEFETKRTHALVQVVSSLPFTSGG
jgi:hypothetical protein